MHAGNACSTTRQSREALDPAVGAPRRATVGTHAGNACSTTRQSREALNPAVGAPRRATVGEGRARWECVQHHAAEP